MAVPTATTKFRKSGEIRAFPVLRCIVIPGIGCGALHWCNVAQTPIGLISRWAKRGQARSFAKAAKFEPAPVLHCILVWGICAAPHSMVRKRPA